MRRHVVRRVDPRLGQELPEANGGHPELLFAVERPEVGIQVAPLVHDPQDEGITVDPEDRGHLLRGAGRAVGRFDRQGGVEDPPFGHAEAQIVVERIDARAADVDVDRQVVLGIDVVCGQDRRTPMPGCPHSRRRPWPRRWRRHGRGRPRRRASARSAPGSAHPCGIRSSRHRPLDHRTHHGVSEAAAPNPWSRAELQRTPALSGARDRRGRNPGALVHRRRDESPCSGTRTRRSAGPDRRRVGRSAGRWVPVRLARVEKWRDRAAANGGQGDRPALHTLDSVVDHPGGPVADAGRMPEQSPILGAINRGSLACPGPTPPEPPALMLVSDGLGGVPPVSRPGSSSMVTFQEPVSPTACR